MDQSDPRRLVVMAALALAGALEDGDQVMIAGLNELASGAQSGPAFVSPRELLAGRDGAEGSRALEGLERRMAHGGQTPCRQALARARSILDAVASSGAPQTLLLLTDGACNGGAVEPAASWLGSLRSHQDGRFRFVLLRREGRERIDPALVEYARRTGWTGEASVSFDARALLRAFAEVLSFSRGLRYDEAGRIGLERTFAGARAVRVLSIHEQGAARIELSRVVGGAASRLTGGPTYRSSFGWSLRAARDGASAHPYAVRSETSGAEVLVVLVYGRLRVEAVVAPCGEPPVLPWDHERAVRAGQPACAWARLVGDAGATVHPTGSFDFQMQWCGDAGCSDGSPMQAAQDGVFHAQLGAELPLGRHERTFRAQGGGLAAPISLRSGFSAVSFGIHRLALAGDPAAPIDRIELGVLPQPAPSDVGVVASGAFPPGSHAALRCEIDGDQAVRACVRCRPNATRIALSDPLELQMRVEATALCPAVSDQGGRDLPLSLRLIIAPEGGEMGEHAIPLRATLRYAAALPLELEVEGGARAEASLRVPGPVAPEGERARFEIEGGELRAGATRDGARLRAGDDRLVTLPVFAEAQDCCDAGEHAGTLVLSAQSGGPELRLPITLRVRDPGFWTCPGKQIAFWGLVALAILLAIWVVRGFVTPASFRPGAILAWAESHDALLRAREGDEGWRKLERFVETKRAFRRPARLHLGGARAPLPSLKRLPDDGYIESTEGGGAKLVVRGPGIERFDEAGGWREIGAGEHPVPSRLTLRRAGEIFVQFRR